MAEEGIKLNARTDATKVVTTMLGCLILKNKQEPTSGPLAWCAVSDKGLSFTVNEAKSLQASALLKRELFHEWQLLHDDEAEQEPSFGVNLGALVECLRILQGGGGSLDKPATLHLCYRADVPCLELTLVEASVVTQCKLHTIDMDAVAPVHMDGRAPARIVLRSEVLREGLAELEWGGDASAQRDKRVTVRVGVEPAQLSLTVSSVDIGCEMSYPPESLVSFNAEEELEFDYRFSLVRMALRSIHQSNETLLKLSERGLLGLTLKLPGETVGCGDLFLEFFLYPLVNEHPDSAVFTATATMAL